MKWEMTYSYSWALSIEKKVRLMKPSSYSMPSPPYSEGNSLSMLISPVTPPTSLSYPPNRL
jgi:hypothetical protein